MNSFPQTAMSLAIQKAAAPLLAAANVEANTTAIVQPNTELHDRLSAEEIAASRNGTHADVAKPSNEEARKLRALQQFDPLIFFEDSHVALRKEVLTSAAWAVDSEIVQAAKALYFQIYNEQKLAHPGEKVTLDLVVDGFSASCEIEGFWGEGLALKLIKLVSMQRAYHDAAYSAANSAGWITFQVKSIDELVLASKPMQLSANELANIKATAPLVARMTNNKMTPEQIEKNTIKILEEKAAEAAEFGRSLLPAVKAIVHEALYVVSELDHDYSFTDLDAKTRVGILAKLRPSVTRPMSDRILLRGNTVEFMLISGECFNASEYLSEVLDMIAREIEQQRHEE